MYKRQVLIVRDGRAFTRLQWSSSNYDYMIVDGEKYLPVNEEGMNSIFEIPILAMDEPVEVIADTTAMGTPHEVEYTLLFYADSIEMCIRDSISPDAQTEKSWALHLQKCFLQKRAAS